MGTEENEKRIITGKLQKEAKHFIAYVLAK